MTKKAKKKTATRKRTARKTAKATTKVIRGRTASKKKRTTYNTPIGDIAKKYGIPLKPGMSPDTKVGDFLIANGSPAAARLLKGIAGE